MLTADIAAEALFDVRERDLDRPDLLLGEMADHGIEVHRRVAARIGEATSRPNELHEAIVDLARAAPAIRIVTTNYDLHLSTMLIARGATPREYVAPALPMGDDFTGLVYLHGNLSCDPRQLIVTDEDFGRAYLRDAWAARFLERMFAEYVTLFVGYSHSDVVMQYLARGLRPGSQRYVLDTRPDAAEWKRLRVHAIGYDVVDGSHKALAEALAGWASLASMGLLDHRQRLMELTQSPPSQLPDEASYLEASVADAARVSLFVEFARGEEWLTWIAEQPAFKRLFSPSASPSKASRDLAYWFVEHFVMSEALTGSALRVVQALGGRLGPDLWFALGHRLHMRQEPRPVWMSPWIVLLVQGAPEGEADWLEYALVASRWPEDRVTIVLLLEHLTRPSVVLQPTYASSTWPARFSINIPGTVHWLRDAWEQVCVPRLDEVTHDVLPIIERQLRRAHELLVATRSVSEGWDPVSFSRSAIEPHSQDAFPDPFHVVIDIARDCLEALLDAGDPQAGPMLERWANSAVPLLRRLSVHGWIRRPDLDASAKITWLRDRGWLFDHQLHHEVFMLVAQTLAAADPTVADALVADAEAGPTDDSPARRERASRRALAWFVEHAPDLASAQAAYQRIERPDLPADAHPDVLSWMEIGWVEPQPPMTIAQLHDRIIDDAQAALDQLRTFENVDSPFDEGPTWQDALSVLRDTARDHPSDGHAVLDVAHGHNDIVQAVVDGWAASALGDDDAHGVLDRLATLDLTHDVAGTVARLLSRSNSEPTGTPWHRFTLARTVAVKAWSALDPHEESAVSDVDGLSLAINHPAGDLALFWVHALAHDWRSAGTSWQGLPSELRTPLEQMLSETDARTAMAEVILASQIRVLYGSDADWTVQHVLPLLLDWNDRLRAERAWDGFLAWGRPTDPLLAEGLLDGYLAVIVHAPNMRDGARRRLAKHFAAIALTSDQHPDAWLPAFTATADVGDRIAWMHEIGDLLRELPSQAIEREWQRWMSSYWQRRLDAVPVSLTPGEAAAIVAWVPRLGDNVEAAVTLAVQAPAGLEQHTDLLRELSDERLDRWPLALPKLVAHLLSGTQPPFWHCEELRRILGRVRAHADAGDVTTIVEHAVRLGCLKAPNW